MGSECALLNVLAPRRAKPGTPAARREILKASVLMEAILNATPWARETVWDDPNILGAVRNVEETFSALRNVPGSFLVWETDADTAEIKRAISEAHESLWSHIYRLERG